MNQINALSSVVSYVWMCSYFSPLHPWRFVKETIEVAKSKVLNEQTNKKNPQQFRS